MKNNGFTLMELMIVVFIVGLLAGFAIPNYGKSVQKARERDAVLQLSALHAANEIYRAQNDETYLVGTALSASTINSSLRINLIPNNVTYSYTSAAGVTYSATADEDDNKFQLELTQAPLSASNPCCNEGTCYTRPDCP